MEVAVEPRISGEAHRMIPAVSVQNELPAPPALIRRPWIDAIRGLALLLMAFNHFVEFIPPFRDVRVNPYRFFGFFSMAEVFVFISGISAALAYSNTPDRRRSFKRARQIYSAHCLTLFLVTVPNLNSGAELLPLKRFFLGLVFLYQPALLDILPLYVGFLVALPFILKLIKLGKWTRLALLSGGAWIFTQFFCWTDAGRDHGEIVLPIFNALGWQALFVLGLTAGRLSRESRCTTFVEKHRRGLVGVFGLITVTFFILNFIECPIRTFMDRWAGIESLGPVRILNFLSFAGLISVIAPALSKLHPPKFLQTLGRNSLPVFVWSISICYLGEFFLRQTGWANPVRFVALLALLTTLPCLAWTVHTFKLSRSRSPIV